MLSLPYIDRDPAQHNAFNSLFALMMVYVFSASAC